MSKEFKQKFVTNKNYDIHKKDGSIATYYVLSVVNAFGSGHMALSVKHPLGYKAFVMVNDIQHIKIVTKGVKDETHS